MTENKICSAIFVIVLMHLNDVSCSTLSHGTVGREFYIGVLKPYTIDLHEHIALIITSTSANSSSGSVNVQVPYLNTNYTRTFVNSKKLELTISNSVIQSNIRQVERRGIFVKSSTDVSVLVVTSYNQRNADARETFLALPKSLLSDSYIVSSYNTTYSLNSEFLIVASEKATTVNISNTRTNQSPTTPITMNTLDTYLFNSRQDLSGTIISSDKPIAVFSGHEAAGVRCNYNHYFVDQNLPTKFYDHTFLVPPLPPKSSYVVRIYGLEPYTHFKYNFSARNEIVTLAKPGEVYEIFHNYTPVAITSDKPVQVMIYSTCYYFERNHIGGSTMSIIPSINQYDNVYHFTIPSLFSDTDHYLAIMTNDVNISKDLRLDGQNNWWKTNEYNLTASGDNYFVYIYRIQPGTYKLETLNGQRFGAIAYGYGRSDDIAYSNILGLKVGGCEGLSTPVGGKVVMLNGTGYQSQVVYSCLQGYKLRGSSTRTCYSSGQWSGVMPTCEPIVCRNLAAPANGDIRTPNGTKYGNVAEYLCNHGYTIQGQRTRTCNENGNWSGIDSTCEPVDCKALSAPGNGYVHTPNGTTFKHQAEYTCSAGYLLKGESVRKCNASGHWSGTAPSCDKIGSRCVIKDKYKEQKCDEGLTCLKCTGVYHTNLCDTITKCPRGQVCYVEKFTTHNGEVKYNSGCLEGRQCDISRRSVNCIECCTSDLCNFGGCGSQGLPPRDQRGPLCYDCALTYNMTECGSISLCQPYEVCSIEKFDWGGLYDQYTTECKARHCLTSKSIQIHPNIMTRSIPVCQQCCENDLCNSGCINTAETSSGLTIVG